MKDHANFLLNHNTSYVAVNVISKRERDLQRCIEEMLSEVLQRENVMMTSDDKRFLFLSSVLTSAIMLTEVYIDQISQEQILLVVYEIKLIVYCDLNKKIAESYAEIHRFDKEEYLKKLLRDHEKMFK
jgi:hypothetical protein